MKKMMYILSVIAAFLFVSNVDSQVLRLSKDQTWGDYTGVAGDTARSTTAKNFDIFLPKDYLYHYEIQVSVDSSGSNAADFAVALYGSMDETNWYAIGSALWYGCTTTDTVMRFTNIPTAETWTVAQHTITTASALDIGKGTALYHRADTGKTGGVADYTLSDSTTVAARTATVAAQTYTINKTLPVGWRYLRLAFTGKGSTSRCEIERITCAISKQY